MDLLFYGKDINDCLNQASKELNIPVENIKYKVLKTSGLFNRTTEIKVTLDKFNTVSEEITNQTLNDNDNFTLDNNANDSFESGIKVENGEIIIISDPNNTNNEKFTIRACDGINLKINDVLCQSKIPYPVYENDILSYTASTVESHRKMDIRISEDKMNVYSIIEYTPEYTYYLKDTSLSKNLVLRARKRPGSYPKKYTPNELKTALYNLKVRNGIIDEVLNEVCEGTLGAEILVAKGTPQVNDKEDEIKILFKQEEKNHFDVDSKEKIDYRNLNNLSNVKKVKFLRLKFLVSSEKMDLMFLGQFFPKKLHAVSHSKPQKDALSQKIKLLLLNLDDLVNKMVFS